MQTPTDVGYSSADRMYTIAHMHDDAPTAMKLHTRIGHVKCGSSTINICKADLADSFELFENKLLQNVINING